MDALIKIMKNSKYNAQKEMLYHVIVAVGKLEDKRATEALLETVHYWENDDSIVIIGINALGMIGDIQAVDYIDAWLRAAAKSAVRIAAAKALGDIGGQKAITKLLNRLDSKLEKDLDVIQAIKWQLERIPVEHTGIEVRLDNEIRSGGVQYSV